MQVVIPLNFSAAWSRQCLLAYACGPEKAMKREIYEGYWEDLTALDEYVTFVQFLTSFN